MNDCCASSSPRNMATTSSSGTPPSYTVRPGVTFPDWSVVASPVVRDALQAMVGSDHVLDRWSGYDAEQTAFASGCSSFTPKTDELRR